MRNLIQKNGPFIRKLFGVGANALLPILASQNGCNTTEYWKNSSWQSLCVVLWNKAIVSLANDMYMRSLSKFSTFSGFVDADKDVSYSENRNKFVSKGKGKDFKSAVMQMDEYISNPEVYHFLHICIY